MKARVKATGEIGIVANIDLLFGCKGYRYQSDEVEIIDSYAEVAGNDTEIDYWTRLEHKATIAAMQGVLANNDLLMQLLKRAKSGSRITHVAVKFANACAHTFVEKLKGKEEK
jgi:hypothetical protein